MPTQLLLSSKGQRLEDFTYTNEMMGDLLLRSIWDVEFVGVKGDVFFDENGDSPREVQIFQYRGELWWFDRLLFIIV